jgi:hypothetical protein
MHFHHQSLWTKLPAEVHTLILSYADELTQFINGYLPDPQEYESIAMWNVVFEIDWQGDLNLLPRNAFPMATEGLCKVKTRSMYYRLCKMFPELIEEAVTRQNLFKDLNLEQGWTLVDKTLRFMNSSLINIPLRHGWLDDPYVKNLHKSTLAIYVCYFGHEDLMDEYIPVFKRILPFMFTDTEGSDFDLILDDYILPAHYLAQQEKHSAILKLARNNMKLCTYPSELVLFDVHVLEELVKNNYLGLNSSIANHLLAGLPVEQLETMIDFVPTELFTDNSVVGFLPLHVIEKLHGKGFFDSIADNVVDIAARNELKVLQYVHRLFPTRISAEAFTNAAETGEIENLIFLKNNTNLTCPPDTIDVAAGNGQFEVVKYLHEEYVNDIKCTVDAMDSAARAGHFDIFQYLHKNRMEGCSLNALSGAMMCCHLNIVRYITQEMPHLKCSDTGLVCQTLIGEINIHNTDPIEPNPEWIDFVLSELKNDGNAINEMLDLSFHVRMGCVENVKTLLKYKHLISAERATAGVLQAIERDNGEMVRLLFENLDAGPLMWSSGVGMRALRYI